jgi:signal peptidase II
MTLLNPAPRAARLFWGTAAAIIIADLVSKILVERMLAPRYVPHRVIGNFVRFTLAYNRGAAFSMWLGEYSREIFGSLAVVALVVLWRLYRLTGRGIRGGDATRLVALGLAWGGAAGNLIDRLRSSLGVVDFIDVGYGAVRFYTFNVADSAVTVGALLLAWSLSQEEHDEHLAHTASRRNEMAGPEA